MIATLPAEVPVARNHDLLAIHPENGVALALRHAAETGGRVRIAAGDAVYELDVHLMPESEVESEAERIARAKAAIRRATGAWQGLIDVDTFLEDLYAQRRRVDRPQVDFERG